MLQKKIKKSFAGGNNPDLQTIPLEKHKNTQKTEKKSKKIFGPTGRKNSS